MNTEWAFGTHFASVTTITYLKRTTKCDTPSCAQCSESSMKRLLFVVSLDDGKGQKQTDTARLETGYADGGRRSVRSLHPAVDIIAGPDTHKNNDSFMQHFSEVAK